MLRERGKHLFFGLLGDAIQFWEGASDAADVAVPLLVTRMQWWAGIVTQRIGDVLAVFTQLWERMSTGWRDVLAWMGRGIVSAVRAWGDVLAQLGKNLWNLITSGEWDSAALREKWRAAIQESIPDFEAIGITFQWTPVESLDEVLKREREKLKKASEAAANISSAQPGAGEEVAENVARPKSHAEREGMAKLVLGGTYEALRAAMTTRKQADAVAIARKQLDKTAELVEVQRRQLRILEALEATP